MGGTPTQIPPSSCRAASVPRRTGICVASPASSRSSRTWPAASSRRAAVWWTRRSSPSRPPPRSAATAGTTWSTPRWTCCATFPTRCSASTRSRRRCVPSSPWTRWRPRCWRTWRRRAARSSCCDPPSSSCPPPTPRRSSATSSISPAATARSSRSGPPPPASPRSSRRTSPTARASWSSTTTRPAKRPGSCARRAGCACTADCPSA